MSGNKWVNVSHDFGLPLVVFTLSARDVVCHGVRQLLAENEGDPVKLEAAVTELMVRCRPELAGGVLVGMDMQGPFTMRFYYWHPKLPRHTQYGQMPPELPLIPPVNEAPADVATLVREHGGWKEYVNSPEYRGPVNLEHVTRCPRLTAYGQCGLAVGHAGKCEHDVKLDNGSLGSTAGGW